VDPYRESAAPPSNVRRYVPSGAGGLVTLIDVFGIASLAGIAAGAVEGFVDEWFSLLVFFPMLIGLAAGGAAMWMIGRKRLRAPMRAAGAAVLGAALGYTAMHVVDYERFRSRVAADVAADVAATADAGGVSPDEAIDDSLVAETGHGGFVGYMYLAAQQGIAITSAGHSHGSDMTFSGMAAWGLWLAELLLAAGVAGAMGYKRAGHPFCEPCDAWFTDGGSNLVATPSVPGKKRVAGIVSAIDGAAIDAIGQAFALPATSSSAIVLVVRACTSCKDEMAATLRSVWHDGRKAKSRDHATWVMARNEAQAIGDAVVRARAEQPR
jgi:hypothetical protein